MRSNGDREDPTSAPPFPVADRGADDGVESEAFLVAFESFAQAVRRARGTTAVDADGRLTFSQLALVRALSCREAARVSELAGDAEVTPSTATRILDALERREIVRRDRAAEDRRAVTVTLTPAGRAALAHQDTWMRGRQRAFYEQLPESEREPAARLLTGMAQLIDELAAGPPPPAADPVARRLDGAGELPA